MYIREMCFSGDCMYIYDIDVFFFFLKTCSHNCEIATVVVTVINKYQYQEKWYQNNVYLLNIQYLSNTILTHFPPPPSFVVQNTPKRVYITILNNTK